MKQMSILFGGVLLLIFLQNIYLCNKSIQPKRVVESLEAILSKTCVIINFAQVCTYT